MFTDPAVTEYVSPVPLTREVAEAAAAHYRAVLAAKGYGWWAIQVKDGASFAGAIMLQDLEFPAAFMPAIEVGWALPRASWGLGYATEGARAALDYAFTDLNLDEVVSLTTAANLPSRRVMERLGMTHDLVDGFDHPQLPPDHLLSRCVLYRMKRPTGD
jgi:ribosomal-protein-alanine N-acetyltransferase